LRIAVEKQDGLEGKKLKFAIVISRFNPRITGKLLEGSLRGLEECQVQKENIRIVEVPGAFEIPQAAARIVKFHQVDAVICLGAVIRGGTPHFEYISTETARGIMAAGLQSAIPFIFGVLTVDNVKQAVGRSSGRNNKGREAALAAVEMALLFKRIKNKNYGTKT
jgi:6,7-dimethyl-8-ribityllumazine synthase